MKVIPMKLKQDLFLKLLPNLPDPERETEAKELERVRTFET